MSKKERIEKAATQIIAGMMASPKPLNRPMDDKKLNPIKHAVDVAERLIEEIDSRY